MSLDIYAPGNLWTNATDMDAHSSRLPPVCRLTANGHKRLDKHAHNARIGYAWLVPGEESRTLAQRVAGRFVADLETCGPSTPEAKRWAFWTGRAREAADAAVLAPISLGVTSHGYPKRCMLPALREFIKAGKPVFPQVYDRIGEDSEAADDVAFLHRCIDMHAELGFTRVIPLLNLKRGPEVVRAQIEACIKRGVSWQLWRAGLFTRSFAFVADYLPAEHPARIARDRAPAARPRPGDLAIEVMPARVAEIAAEVQASRAYDGPLAVEASEAPGAITDREDPREGEVS